MAPLQARSASFEVAVFLWNYVTTDPVSVER
ncbi:MAG: hypothetical protein JWM11_4167 [Planctomycetaceae bacterium]|nr:hypothetical protein [Planctomycetaceae bacterium]